MSSATEKSSKSGGHLTLYIVIAIFVAVVVSIAGPSFLGESFLPSISVFQVGGEVFLRMLQMVVVPLVMASVMSGIIGLGDVRVGHVEAGVMENRFEGKFKDEFWDVVASLVGRELAELISISN